MQVGIVGLGHMGISIGEKLLQEDHQLVVWNSTREILEQWRIEKSDKIITNKLAINHSISEFRESLLKPRVFLTLLPAGEVTEAALQQISAIADTGDVVIDGGNSYYKDTHRWFNTFSQRAIKFLGIGFGGGVLGNINGFSMMIGGDQSGFDYVRPMLDSLVKPYGCYTYFGQGGVGHYLKMIHNGIEYGMMQALAEGFSVVAKSDYRVNLLDVANTWQQGSIIEGFLLQMAIDAFSRDPVLEHTEGNISSSGETKWMIEEARAKHIAVNIIEQALKFRETSSYDKGVQETFTAKLIQAMRKEFAGNDEAPPAASGTNQPQEQ